MASGDAQNEPAGHGCSLVDRAGQNEPCEHATCVAGVAQMVGYPVPKVPEGWRKGAQSSVEMLKLVRI